MSSLRSPSKFIASALVITCAVQSVAISAHAADPAPASTESTPAPAPSSATPAPAATGATAATASATTPSAQEAALGSYWTPRRIIGFMMLGSGVVTLGVGAGLGLQAKGRYDTATNENGQIRNTDSAHAVSEGNVATGMIIAGSVIAAGGLVLWITAPSTPSTTPQVGTNGTSVFVRGNF